MDALVQRGWNVMRAIDAYLEKTPDPVVFERAAKEERVFVTNDEGILKTAAAWLEAGRTFRMIFWPQEDYRAWTVGELAKTFEELAAQDDPFRYPVLRLRPRRWNQLCFKPAIQSRENAAGALARAWSQR